MPELIAGIEQEELIRLAVAGLGAGAKGTVTGYLKNMLPGVSEDVAAIIAGGAIWYFGGRFHPLLRAFGAGILIAGIGQATKGMIPALGGGGSSSPSRSPAVGGEDTLAMLAAAQASTQVVHS